MKNYLDPKRFDGFGALVVNGDSVRKVDHFIFRSVNDQHGWGDSGHFVNAAQPWKKKKKKPPNIRRKFTPIIYGWHNSNKPFKRVSYLYTLGKRQSTRCAAFWETLPACRTSEANGELPRRLRIWIEGSRKKKEYVMMQEMKCQKKNIAHLEARSTVGTVPMLWPYRMTFSGEIPYLVRKACQAASTSAYRFFSEGLPVLIP